MLILLLLLLPLLPVSDKLYHMNTPSDIVFEDVIFPTDEQLLEKV